MKYQRFDADGTAQPSPIDDAIFGHLLKALCPDVPEAARQSLPEGLPGADL